jgi:hypothetical protein
MIPQPHRDNFNTLNQAFNNGAACLLECHEQATGRPVYVICAVNRRSPEDYDLVPFAQLFGDNPYALLAPPGEMADPSANRLKESRP